MDEIKKNEEKLRFEFKEMDSEKLKEIALKDEKLERQKKKIDELEKNERKIQSNYVLQKNELTQKLR